MKWKRRIVLYSIDTTNNSVWTAAASGFVCRRLQSLRMLLFYFVTEFRLDVVTQSVNPNLNIASGMQLQFLYCGSTMTLVCLRLEGW